MAKYKNPDYPEGFNTPITISGDEPGEGLVPFIEKLVTLKEYYGVDWDTLAIHLAVDNLEGFQVRPKKKVGTPPDTVGDLRFFVEMEKRLADGYTQGKAARNVANKFPDLAKDKRAAEDRYRNIKKDKPRFKRLKKLISTLSSKSK